MPEARRIEGFVIVSSDGMIAAADRHMPAAIRNAADQEFFQAALDRAAVIVHGRHSHEGGPRADARKRVVLSRRTAAIANEPDYPNAVLWNPQGAPLAAAIAALDAGPGTIAIIGGPAVFTMFLPLYAAFYLSHAPRAEIPGGLPAFEGMAPGGRPQDVLALHGLGPVSTRVLDAAADVSVVTWEREAVSERKVAPRPQS